jgi:hypothetical protein
MKTPFQILTAVFSLFSLAACNPGELEFGYAFNPVGVLHRALVDLKENQYDGDWILLFNSKLTCEYTSEEVVSHLKKTLGNTDLPSKAVSIQSMTKVAEGKTIKGYQEVMGKILSGERYRIVVQRDATQKPILDIMMSCFTEYSSGQKHQYCFMTDIQNLVKSTPRVPVCE